MGVRGFRSFIENNLKLVKTHKLHDCYVIIDGSNLFFTLYRFLCKNTCSYVYGGDYFDYTLLLKNFFRILNKCNIIPFVVIDGGLDISGEKFETVFKRLQTTFFNCRKASKADLPIEMVLPSLIFEVSQKVLKEIKVICLTSLFEADLDILLLANHFNAYVLSSDSDFLLFQVNAGVISLDSFDINSLRKFSSPSLEGKSEYYIDCSLYNINDLLNRFPGLNPDLLYLFSCIMGNDYVTSQCFRNIFSQMPGTDFLPHHLTERNKKMFRVLSWFREKNESQIIQLIFRSIQQKYHPHAEKLIKITKKNFGVHKKESALLHFICEEFNEIEVYLDVTTKLPKWFINKHYTCEIPSIMLNMVCTGICILPQQINDFRLPSSNASCIFLFKTLLDLMNSIVSPIKHIIVYDRINENITKTIMYPENLPNFLNLAIKSEISSVNLIYILGLLNSNMNILNSFVNLFNIVHNDSLKEFGLFLVAIKYWSKYSNCCLESFVSLLTCVLYHFSLSCKKWSKKNINNEEKKNLQIKFSKFAVVPTHKSSNFFQARIVHYYSQFQSIIYFVSAIISITDMPWTPMRVASYLNGTIIYNLTLILTMKECPFSYVNELFGIDSKLSYLFMQLINKMQVSLERFQKEAKPISHRKSRTS